MCLFVKIRYLDNGVLRYIFLEIIINLHDSIFTFLKLANIPFKGQSIAAIFEKRSTRTRFAFEAGAHSLGAHAIFCNKDDIHLGTTETIQDTALVLSRLSELITARVFEHSHLEEMCKYSKVPVVNALSDIHHPTQALADLLTIYEHFGHLKGIRVAWVGDGNNVLNSLLIACTKMKMHFASSTPIGYVIFTSLVYSFLKLNEL